jgi:hypothetical protein
MKLKFDCGQCPGFCCSHGRIAVTDHDIKRLASHFSLPLEVARRKFTYRYRTEDGEEQLLRHHKDHIYSSICKFFDRDERRCTVYEARPYVCRKYPYGNKCGYFDFLKFERAHQDDPDYIPHA